MIIFHTRIVKFNTRHRSLSKVIKDTLYVSFISVPSDIIEWAITFFSLAN